MKVPSEGHNCAKIDLPAPCHVKMSFYLQLLTYHHNVNTPSCVTSFMNAPLNVQPIF